MAHSIAASMEKQVFDVVVVGAGLSGLRTADLLAAKGYAVAVIGTWRSCPMIRTCAGVLGPRTGAALHAHLSQAIALALLWTSVTSTAAVWRTNENGCNPHARSRCEC